MYAHSFTEISKIRQEPKEIEILLKKHGKEHNLESLMLKSRSHPAFSTFVSSKSEKTRVDNHELLLFVQTEIRLSSFCVSVYAQLTPSSLLTFRQGMPLIHKVKEATKQKLTQCGEKLKDFTPALLLEVPQKAFAALNEKHLEAELPRLLGFQDGDRFSYSISFSKLGEEDEQSALLVIAFREAGILKEIWVIGPKLDGMLAQNRARWWSIASLSCHAAEIAKRGYDNLLQEIAELEEQIEAVTSKAPRVRGAGALFRFFQDLTELRKKLSTISYKFATLKELVECVKKNMQFVNWSVRLYPSSENPVPVSEKVVACTDKCVLLPGFIVRELSGSTWIDVPQTAQEMMASPYFHFAIQSPVLGRGLVGQTQDILELILGVVEEQESRSNVLIERLSSHVADTLRVAESETTLLLQETQIRLARRTEKVERSFGLLSLIFAVFSLGQVVSAFVIWYWGSASVGQFLPLEHFFLALGVTVFVMLVAMGLVVRAFYRE